jgi:phosphoenolpyruvate synthase/pyruvate phosphate dikinase
MKCDKRNWEIFWEIPDCPPFLTMEPARFFTQQMKDFCGHNFSDCILEYNQNVNIWYLDSEEWSRLDKNLFENMLKNVNWAKKINIISENSCKPCFSFLDSMIGIDYTNLSRDEIFKIYDKFMEIYIPAHASGHPANVLEIKNQRLSRYLKTYLMNRFLEIDKKQNADEVFGVLVEPIENMSVHEEAISFYNLALDIIKNKAVVKVILENETDDSLLIIKNDFEEVWNLLKTHHKNFCWTPFNWEGPENNLEYYLENIKSLIRQKYDIQSELEKLKNRGRVVQDNKNKIITELNIDEKHKKLVDIASGIMFLKSLRKDCMYKGAWVTDPLYREIGKRLNLSTHEARFIFRSEMKKALIDGKINNKLIKSRTKELVVHQRSRKSDLVFCGREAHSFVKSLGIKKIENNIKEVKGQIAYPGKVRGFAKYVNTPDMINKMKDGDILIAYATQPNLLPAMKKASAFVTDFGGITCHAAIVAREWKVPCIIGTGIATKVFKDGDLVEVDANTGIVKIIKKA